MNRVKALTELGFKPGDEPTDSEIKKKYHQLALQFHPDKNSAEGAKEKFQAIQEASEFLRKPRHEQVEGDGDFFARSSSGPCIEYYCRLKVVDKERKVSYERTVKNKMSFAFSALLSDRLSKGTNITIYSEGLRLPPDGAESILTELLQNNIVRKVNHPKDLFDEGQLIDLKNHLARNRQSLEKANSQNRKIIMIFVGAYVSFVLSIAHKVAVAGLGVVGTSILAMALGAFCGYSLSKIHKAYLAFAAKYYDTPDKILTVKSPSEKSALLAGLNVKNIKTYLKSFLIKSTWHHPLAFAAGLFHRQEYNYELREVIRTACTTGAYSANPGSFSREMPYASSEAADIEAPSPTYRPSEGGRDNDEMRSENNPSQSATAFQQKRNAP